MAGWLSIDTGAAARPGRTSARGRSRAVERKLALVAVITTLLALLPGVVGAQERVRVSLPEAVAQAFRGSEAVEVAEAGLLRARGDRFQARSGFLPKLNGTVGYTRTLRSEFSGLGGEVGEGGENPFEGMELPFGQRNRYDVGVQASHTVFAGGQVVARSRVAEAGVRSAAIGVSSARAQLELDVTEAYYGAVLSDRLVAIAEAGLAQAEATLEQLRSSQRVGEAAEFDVLRAQVTRDNQRPVVIQRRADRVLAHMRLKQLLDVSMDAELELTTDLPVRVDLVASAAGDGAADDSPWPEADTASSSRAAVRQAAELVKVRENLRRAAVGERLPVIALTSEWGRVAYPRQGVPGWDDMRSNWTVGVQVRLPLVTGGAQRGTELRAQADVVEARARLEQTREAAALDARSALERLTAAESAWEASAGTVEQAERAYRIAEIRFREGLSTQIELSDARLMLQQAEMNRAVAARDLEVARTVFRLLPELPLGR